MRPNRIDFYAMRNTIIFFAYALSIFVCGGVSGFCIAHLVERAS
ncbi:MAG: hypothetical protein AB7O04_10265 [Hyphomonadaceae bacterium]